MEKQSKVYVYEELVRAVDHGKGDYGIIVVYEGELAVLVVSDDLEVPPYMQVKNAKQYVQAYIKLREQGLIHQKALLQLKSQEVGSESYGRVPHQKTDIQGEVGHGE
jgi:hypothetical protein